MTIRNLGDFTSAIHKVPVGQRVYLDGPYGAFTIGNPADMHVLIAGGIGITPMMSMIRTLADRRDPRPVTLLYGSKDWESIMYREELEALKGRLDLTIVHVLSDPPADWTGEQGRITAEVFRRHLPPPHADSRILHLRARRDDGRDREGARRAARAHGEIPFRTLQLRIGGQPMRRLFANRVAFATGAIVILMAVLFALSRVAS